MSGYEIVVATVPALTLELAEQHRKWVLEETHRSLALAEKHRNWVH